jgi:hypothetical protein
VILITESWCKVRFVLRDSRRDVRSRLQQLWTACGSRYLPTANTAQPAPQRPIQTCLDMTVPISLVRLVMLLRRLRVPQVDVQTLDLFDQQENRFSGRAKLLIATVDKTRAPGAELFDLALV